MLDEIQTNMAILAPYRKSALFNKFLVQGYTHVTLSCVPKSIFADLLEAKLCLGTLITLYDDFADRPSQRNPKLLKLLYKFNFGTLNLQPHLDTDHRHVVEFARTLFTRMETLLRPLPQYQRLIEILKFDLSLFYVANQYSSLVTDHPFMTNVIENQHHTHHNMGMIMIGMMDLMAAEQFNLNEMGLIREVLFLGQRFGRICNILTTSSRELADGDITGELAICKSPQQVASAKLHLRAELDSLRGKILNYDPLISAFSVKSYTDGLLNVQRLHEEMEGTI